MITSPIGLYQILYEIVRCYIAEYEPNVGAEITCRRPNSFAVIKQESDVENAVLSKDLRYISKRLFYSRKWNDKNQQPSQMEVSYPLLAISRGGTKFTDPFCTQEQDCIKFALYLFDQLPGKCSSCGEQSYCNKRTWEEMEDDLTKMMKHIMQILGRYIYAVVQWENGNETEGYYDGLYLECQQEEGNVTSYECVDEITNYIQDTVVEGDTFFEAYSDNLGVIVINFTFCFCDCNAQGIKQNWDKPEPVVKADEGCTTC